MTKYHVEYDVEVQPSQGKPNGWSDEEHGVRYAEGVIPGAPSTRLISAPATAIITEIKEPIKIGDTLFLAEDLNRLPDGSVLLSTDEDALQKDTVDGVVYWFRQGTRISSDAAADYSELRVIYIPESDE